MFKREISMNEVNVVLNSGDIINEYPDDKPYPCFLLLGFSDHRPLHLVVAKDMDTETCILVTVYEPDKNMWSADLKIKMK